MSASGSNYSAASERLADLFEQHQGVAIPRNQVEGIADQLDYMKRLRRNGGARDILDKKGIALLWGQGDRGVIGKLGLGPVSDKEFISYTPKDQAELDLLRSNGHAELGQPPSW